MCHEALEKLEFTLEVTQFFQGDLIEETTVSSSVSS